MKRLTLLLMIMCAVLVSQAQDDARQDEPFVKYINGSKHIYFERLDLSPNMTVMEFLKIFPEMTTRGSSDVLNNYAIVMENTSLGLIRDEVLNQLTIGELKEIVICDNPSAAYTNNGIGGTIELVPKDLSEGLSGNAQLDVATEPSVLLSANVNFKMDRLKIRSFIKGVYANVTDNSRYRSYFNNTIAKDYNSLINTVASSGIAKFALSYALSDKDDMTFSIWENFLNKNVNSCIISHGFLTGHDYDTSRLRGVGTLARFNYMHRFNDHHRLQYFINYSFSDQWENVNKSDYKYNYVHDVSSGLQYAGDLVCRDNHLLQLVTGVNLSNTKDLIGKPKEPISNYMSVNPLAEFRYTYSNKLFARFGGRYYFDIYHGFDRLSRTTDYHDYMLSGEVNYTLKSGHTLRVSGIRDRLASVNGSKTGDIVSGDFSYILQKSYKKHYFNVTAGFQYDHVRQLTGDKYDIYSAMAAVVWQYRWICLSLVGHVFDNATCQADQSEYYQVYYNLRLAPIFTLPKGWAISADFMYNSKLISHDNVEGDYFYCSLRVSKRINQWSVRAEFADPFHYMTQNVNMEQGYAIYSDFHPYVRYLNLGVSYDF